jgi:hypothetical protein
LWRGVSGGCARRGLRPRLRRGVNGSGNDVVAA